MGSLNVTIKGNVTLIWRQPSGADGPDHIYEANRKRATRWDRKEGGTSGVPWASEQISLQSVQVHSWLSRTATFLENIMHRPLGIKLHQLTQVPDQSCYCF